MSNPKIVIVGGVAGGASTATRARRLNENAEIIVLERGPYISFANCGLAYHIGGEIKERDALLVTTPEQLRSRFKIDVRTRNEVIAIDRTAKVVEVRNLVNDKVYRESYDVLVLSPGAEPFKPAISGINHPLVLTLRNMEDMDGINQALKDQKHVTVIGGGYIGLEMVEALRHRGFSTALIELAPQVMGSADPEMASVLQQELLLQGVDLRLNTSVTSFKDGAAGVVMTLSTGEKLESNLVILAIGVKPEVTLAERAGLALGVTGGIKVDTQMRTSDPSIYAVGDAVEVIDFVSRQPALIPLAGPANRQGRIVADNIMGRASSYSGTQGTAICKVFNQTIAMTGMNERNARRAGIAYEKVYVNPACHASYYPGASPVSIKLLFDPQSGRVLGAQAVGVDGIDKRIDVLALAVRSGLTVFDLENAELTYAPPYGSARDPVNYAAFVAANTIRGDVGICHVDEVLNPAPEQRLLDVSTPEEYATSTISGAKNIPVDEMRQRMKELSKEREYLVFCRVGLRGYIACRILTQHGFKCRNLSGGSLVYQRVTGGTVQPVSCSDDGCSDHLPAGQEGTARTPQVALELDACGLQCPGPVMQMKAAMARLKVGETLAITASDPGFVADAPAWCRTTGNRLLALEALDGGIYRALVERQAPPATTTPAAGGGRSMTNVVFSADFDKAMATFIIANGAAAAGYEVTLFFTFWGINMLRRSEGVAVAKTPLERMFGWMMPRGAGKLKLSKMQMGGLGLAMIKGIMAKKQVMPLPELIKQAQANGVRLVVCSMSMDLMGIKRAELIDGVEEGGVAMYIEHLSRPGAGLFIA